MQDLLARAAAEFDGPAAEPLDRAPRRDRRPASRPSARQGALPAARPRDPGPGLRAARRARTTTSACRRRRRRASAPSSSSSPQHALSKEKVSPKVVDYFNSVKKALVGLPGRLLQARRARGSRLNGEFLSLTDFFPLEVLAGEYTVEIARDGYRTETRTLSIAPQGHGDAGGGADAHAGQRVLRHGAGGRRGLGRRPAPRHHRRDAWRPSCADAVRAQGPRPGARLGAHRDRATSPWAPRRRVPAASATRPVRRTLEAPGGARLRHRAGPPRGLAWPRCSSRSDPPGARIFLDGEAMGHDAQGARRRLLRQAPRRGQARRRASSSRTWCWPRTRALTLDCPIRPSLAFLGVVAESAAGERVVADVEEKLVQNLAQITTLNFIPAPRETVDRILEAEKLTRKGLVPGAGADAGRRAQGHGEAGRRPRGAGLPGGAAARRRSCSARRCCTCWPPATPSPTAGSVSLRRDRLLPALPRRGGPARPPLYRPWTGLITVDTLLHEGVPVLRVVPGSPAAAGGRAAGRGAGRRRTASR